VIGSFFVAMLGGLLGWLALWGVGLIRAPRSGEEGSEEVRPEADQEA
jgi:hypothetical protein